MVAGGSEGSGGGDTPFFLYLGDIVELGPCEPLESDSSSTKSRVNRKRELGDGALGITVSCTRDIVGL